LLMQGRARPALQVQEQIGAKGNWPTFRSHNWTLTPDQLALTVTA
jgi:hypothetical protein